MINFESSSERISEGMSFEEKVKNGLISPDEARKIQKEKTGHVVGGEREAVTVKFDNGDEKTFQDAAEVLRWVDETGGLIYRSGGDEGSSYVAFGKEVDHIMEEFKRKKRSDQPDLGEPNSG